MAINGTELFNGFSEFVIYLQSTVGTGYIWIYALVLLAVVIYTVIQLRKQVGKAEDKRKDQLREQFKRGEISKEKYEAEIKETEF